MTYQIDTDIPAPKHTGLGGRTRYTDGLTIPNEIAAAWLIDTLHRAARLNAQIEQVAK